MVVVYSPNNGDFRRFQSKLTKIDVKNNAKIEKLTLLALSVHCYQSNSQQKPIKNGMVVVYSPNNGDFRRFQSKQTKIDVENDIK